MHKRRPFHPAVRAQLFEDARCFRARLKQMRKDATPEQFAKLRTDTYSIWRRSREQIVNSERDFHRELAEILERGERLIAEHRGPDGEA
jgi:hypothetical protein